MAITVAIGTTVKGQGLQHIKLRPSQIYQAVLSCIRAREPFMIWGDPGIGKTHIVGQIAAELFGKKKDRSNEGLDTDYFRKFILSQREPSDALGLPVPDKETRTVEWFRPDIFPDSVRGGDPAEGLFFMDEFAQAVPMLQAPARQLLTERRFGPHELPDGWVVGAASNYPHNRAGANKLLTHVGSAIVHLHMVPSLDDFLSWGATNGLRPELLAFLRFRPNLLHDFQTETDTFPCPRTWGKISNIISAEPPAEVAHAVYAGTVGEGAAAELVAFLRVFESLPDIDEIIRNPKGAPLVKQDQVGTIYAVCSALSNKATVKNIGNIIRYIERLPKEFALFVIRDAHRRDAGLVKTEAMGRWIVDNQAFIGV